MERKIGDIFEYLGTKLEVIESESCEDCYFYENGCSERFTIMTGVCVDWGRSDGKCVSFKELS